MFAKTKILSLAFISCIANSLFAQFGTTSPLGLAANSYLVVNQPGGNTTGVKVDELSLKVIGGDTLTPGGKFGVLDMFNETGATLLDSHTPNIGSIWSKDYTDGTPTFTVGANAGTVGPTATVTDQGVIYIAGTALASPNYEVHAEFSAVHTSANFFWLFARYVDNNNFYAVKLSSTASTCRVVKRVAGTFTDLGSTFTLPAGASEVKMKIIGAGITVTANNTVLQNVTDTSISSAGKAGIGSGDIGHTSTDDTHTTWKLSAFKVQYYAPYLIGHYSIRDFYADVQNTSTGETDIFSHTSQANRLSRDGDKLLGKFNLSLTDNTSTATIRAYLGGSKFFDSGAITVSTVGFASVEIVIIRTGSTTARAYATLVTSSNATSAYTQETDLTSLDFTTTNIIKITGQAGGGGGGTGDIVGKMGTISYAPAAQ